MIGNLAFWGLVAYACVVYVVPKWREFHLSDRLTLLPLPWLVLTVGLIGFQYLIVFSGWRRILRTLGAEVSSDRLFRAFALSQLPKYVPGKLLAQGVRARMVLDAGVSGPTIVTSLVWETGLGLASAVFVAGAGLLFGSPPALERATRWIVTAFALLSLVVIALMALPRMGRSWRRWMGLEVARRQLGSMARLCLTYLCSWCLSLAAHWSLARAVSPLPYGQVLPLLVALCVSWGVGALSIFAPGGIGVREGVLFLFARGWMGESSALLFVGLSRLCAFVVEVAFTAVAGFWKVAALPTRAEPSSE